MYLDYIASAMQFCEAIGAKVFVGPMYSAVGKHRLELYRGRIEAQSAADPVEIVALAAGRAQSCPRSVLP